MMTLILHKRRFRALPACLVMLSLAGYGQSVEITPEVHHVITTPGKYRGKPALEVRDAAPELGDGVPRIAVVKGPAFRDGTVEISLAGDTAADAPANFRGFVGIAFRISPDRSRYECIYLRPKNGHSPDAAQRGHAVQYESEPDDPWDRLRAETPGKYEAQADIAPGAWIRIKIQIQGKRALLFVNDESKPVLTLDELKGTVEQGPIALWVGPGTIAHFSGLKVKESAAPR